MKKIENKNFNFERAYKEKLIKEEQLKRFREEIHPNKSIARNGADYMRKKKGFTNCVYYGYLGPLESEYGDEGHKWMSIDGLQNPPTDYLVISICNHAKTIRASKGRVQV